MLDGVCIYSMCSSITVIVDDAFFIFIDNIKAIISSLNSEIFNFIPEIIPKNY